MKKSERLILFICISIFIFYIGGLIAIDEIDPPFIPNSLYSILIYQLGSFISLATPVFFILKGFRRYKIDHLYRGSIQIQFDNFTSRGKCKFFFTLLFSPFLIGLLFWSFFVPAIELSGYYFYTQSWSKEYHLVEVKKCGNDYGRYCSSIEIRDLTSSSNSSFRWYEDRDILTQLKDQRVTIRGYQGLFGSTVEVIQW